MAIEFLCPSCQQRLGVSDESAGKSAKCPRCGTVSPIPAAGTGMPSPTARSATPFGQGSSSPFAEAAIPGGTPFASTSSASSNPYASPQAAFAPKPTVMVSDGPIANHVVSVEPILNHAWNVWKNNLGLLVGMTVIVMVIGVIFSVAQGIVQTTVEQNGAKEAAVAIGLVGNLLGNALQIFLTIGEVRICLKLARGQPAELGDLLQGGPRFLPVLGVSILFGLAVFFGILLFIVPGILLALMWWPCYYLVVDNKCGVIESFSLASTITQGNWGNALLLWLLSFAIGLVGILALCIGIIFAAPLISVLWATAYLMMSGQLSFYGSAGYAGQGYPNPEQPVKW